MNVTERFLRYVTYDTQSDEHAACFPSTQGQMVFAGILAGEMQKLGLKDVRMDENGYVFGVREGTATVTASAGGASASYTITVASSGAVPVLEGVPEALTVLVGSPVKVQPRALYKGNEISVTFGYSSENAQTATFENGTLTGVAAGTVEVIVRAQYYDYILEQSIQVTVVSAA